MYVNTPTEFQTVNFDTDSNSERSGEADLEDIRSGLHETESMQANEPCEEVDPEERPAAMPPTRPTTSKQVPQMLEKDGQTGQADEYETDSDYDETEVNGIGLDSDELALIGVQSRRTS